MANGVDLLLLVTVSYKKIDRNHPHIVAIDCGPQPTPDPNGKIGATQGTSLKAQTIYECNPGYTLEGTKTIYCQNNGEYSDDAPKCKRK